MFQTNKVEIPKCSRKAEVAFEAHSRAQGKVKQPYIAIKNANNDNSYRKNKLI